MTNLPLSPWVYELGNSLISSLAICLVIILVWFFATEIYQRGWCGAYVRIRFKLGLSIAAIVAGDAGYRMWTWWGTYCANSDTNCQWMLSRLWPLVPITSITLELVGMLCMIRILIPEVWGTRAWVISAALSTCWSLYWFSGWGDVVAWLIDLF